MTPQPTPILHQTPQITHTPLAKPDTHKLMASDVAYNRDSSRFWIAGRGFAGERPVALFHELLNNLGTHYSSGTLSRILSLRPVTHTKEREH